ncbi:hypothetical protein JHK82_022583 [Glycine max]|nr:hypothetical protein JHK86_022602 [Glycine max]KAG5137852.1 hypothetical protein JHK82_022583 [Glycine max]
MMDNDALRQLQARITKMERRHEEELIKFDWLFSKSGISILRWRYIPCCWPYDLASLSTVYARNLLTTWMSYESEPMVEHKCDKREGSTRTNSHRSNKRHKHDKCEPFPKGPRYEHYTTLTTNRATILEEAFSMEVPIQLPLIPPPRLCLDRTKHYRHHCNHGHNTEDYWALKDKINQSQKRHLHAIKDIDVNYVDVEPLRSLPPITFTYRDFQGINPISQDDPMVVSIVIANFMVSKVFIDQGSSTDILHWKTFQSLEIALAMIKPHYRPLLGFSREIVEIRPYVVLMTTFGQGKLSRSFTIRYLIIDAKISYFALIGIKTLNDLRAIVSTPHLKMKFLTLMREIVTVKADQKQAQQCYAESLKVASYPPIKEPSKPHPSTGGNNN